MSMLWRYHKKPQAPVAPPVEKQPEPVVPAKASKSKK